MPHVKSSRCVQAEVGSETGIVINGEGIVQDRVPDVCITIQSACVAWAALFAALVDFQCLEFLVEVEPEPVGDVEAFDDIIPQAKGSESTIGLVGRKVIGGRPTGIFDIVTTPVVDA